MSYTQVQQRGFGFNIDEFGPLHWSAIGLAAITGAVHLYLFVDQGFLPFLFAGLGFAGWIVLVTVTKGLYRNLLYLGGIFLASSQLMAFYIVERPTSLGDITALAAGTKLAEMLLIVVLAYLFITEWKGL